MYARPPGHHVLALRQQHVQAPQPLRELARLVAVGESHHLHQVHAARCTQQRVDPPSRPPAKGLLVQLPRNTPLQHPQQLVGEPLTRTLLLPPHRLERLGVETRVRRAGLDHDQQLLERGQRGRVAKHLLVLPRAEERADERRHLFRPEGRAAADARQPLVVLAPRAVVGQHVVGLADGLESLLRAGLVGLVWMPLPCDAVVGVLDLFLRREWRDPQDLVVISFRQMIDIPGGSIRWRRSFPVSLPEGGECESKDFAAPVINLGWWCFFRLRIPVKKPPLPPIRVQPTKIPRRRCLGFCCWWSFACRAIRCSVTVL
mmetsp:Transcript_86308/g.230495  ORF Transcript_86308/g.230495 Transcript_86308/m.230495 type:complete len:316 (+) Transcript_86308:174-1121(+)